MKLISCSESIPVRYDHNDERNVETIFGLNDNNEIIQYTTFQFVIHPDIEALQQAINARQKTIEIDKGFLYYSFRYQISFGHYMCQTVPLLYEYKTHYATKGYKLLVPKNHHNLFQQRLLELVGISEEHIFVLSDDAFYEIVELAPRRRWHHSCIPDGYTHDHLQAWNMIRQGLFQTIGLTNIVGPKTRKVYLKRDQATNTEYGNTEIGILRQISNENELIEHLKSRGFEIIWLGDKSIDEKAVLLSNIDILITPWGSNCFNLIFSSSPKRMFMFGNDRSFGGDYFRRMSEVLNNSYIDYKSKYYNIDGKIIDPTNGSNASFYVDLNDFEY